MTHVPGLADSLRREIAETYADMSSISPKLELHARLQKKFEELQARLSKLTKSDIEPPQSIRKLRKVQSKLSAIRMNNRQKWGPRKTKI